MTGVNLPHYKTTMNMGGGILERGKRRCVTGRFLFVGCRLKGPLASFGLTVLSRMLNGTPRTLICPQSGGGSCAARASVM